MKKVDKMMTFSVFQLLEEGRDLLIGYRWMDGWIDGQRMD